MQENLEEFLTPITPTKHRPAHPQQYLDDQSSLDSPSKGQARNRLGSLLGQIRTGDSGRVHHPRAEETFEDEIGGDKRGPGRPKKMRREKRVVFELRGKPFGLRDSGHPEAIYALCRKWMYGKDDELVGADDEADEPEFDIPRFKSLDLMATREIHALPLPRHEVPLMDPRPQKVLMARDRIGVKQVGDSRTLLGEHKKHWKNVKKNWMDYNQKRQQRYADSLQLLRTVYGIAQQTQI